MNEGFIPRAAFLNARSRGLDRSKSGQTLTKRDILISTNFGRRIAEEEADDLASYFVETEQWRKVLSGDVVYGPKGSGKSAPYSLLRQRRDDLLARGIIPAAAEKVRGTLFLKI